MRLKIGIYLFFALFVNNLLTGQTTAGVATTLVSKGMMVPNFSYEISKGKTAKISDLKGKIVLINFFATWCGPCRTELPKIQAEIWNKHHSNPKFAMLTFGREHVWQEVEKFKQDNNFEFPFFPDPKRAVYGKFATQLIPRSFLLDENGTIIYLSEGFEQEHFDSLVKLIDSKL